MKPKEYEYKGKIYTLEQLYKLFPNVKSSLLNNRLKKGMTVEEAIRPQSYDEWIPEEYRGKNLIICFDMTPPVYPAFQPKLRTPYVATVHGATHTKAFYTVYVNGNKLIVYPGEFRILAVAQKCEERECAPPYGDKADCKLNQQGYCLGSANLNK